MLKRTGCSYSVASFDLVTNCYNCFRFFGNRSNVVRRKRLDKDLLVFYAGFVLVDIMEAKSTTMKDNFAIIDVETGILLKP